MQSRVKVCALVFVIAFLSLSLSLASSSVAGMGVLIGADVLRL